MLPDGRPERHLGRYDIPPEDLDEARTAALTAEQVELINQHDDLYTPIDEKAAAEEPPAVSERADSGGESVPAADAESKE